MPFISIGLSFIRSSSRGGRGEDCGGDSGLPRLGRVSCYAAIKEFLTFTPINGDGVFGKRSQLTPLTSETRTVAHSAHGTFHVGHPFVLHLSSAEVRYEQYYLYSRSCRRRHCSLVVLRTALISAKSVSDQLTWASTIPDLTSANSRRRANLAHDFCGRFAPTIQARGSAQPIRMKRRMPSVAAISAIEAMEKQSGATKALDGLELPRRHLI
jgi:hypothetical protein